MLFRNATLAPRLSVLAKLLRHGGEEMAGRGDVGAGAAVAAAAALRFRPHRERQA